MKKKSAMGGRKTFSPRQDIPPGAKKLFDFFLSNANFDSLHPNDYDRFYEFICYCYKHAVKLNEVDIENLLLRRGFEPNWSGKAKCLAHLYLHGRGILAARKRVR